MTVHDTGGAEAPEDAYQLGNVGQVAGEDVLGDHEAIASARGTPISPSIVTGLVAVSDAAIILLAGLTIHLAYSAWNEQTIAYSVWNEQTTLKYFAIIILNTGMLVGALNVAGLYNFEALTKRRQQLRKIIASSALAFLLVGAFAFALKISDDFSRVWAFSWFGATVVLIVVSRSLYYTMLKKAALAGQLNRNVAVVGAGQQGLRLIKRFNQIDDPWTKVIGIFDDRVGRVGA